MKKSYIKKSVSILFVLCIITLLGVFCFASYPSEITSEVSFVDYFVEPTMEHEAIPSVVANGILNAKVKVDFGDCISANTYLEYNFDGSSSVTTITKENVNSKSDFYMGVPKGEITSDNTKIYYRIKAVLQSSEGEKTLYAPEGASSTAFSTATIVSKIEEEIDGTAGGQVNIFCGDQSKTGDSGNIKVVVPAGAYSSSKTVTVDFLEDIDSVSLVSSSSESLEDIISAVSVKIDGATTETLGSPIEIYNLPLQKGTKANRFVMQYKNDSDWEAAAGANLNVDTTNQIFSFSASALGYYKIIASIALTDSSFRPQNRIVIKSKIGDRYPGFEFKYLKEGDTVSIYNPKGKRIAKLTSGDSNGFVWKGKKGTNNSGDWAKSGIYIYQIKVKETGKLVSGTIVFVY